MLASIDLFLILTTIIYVEIAIVGLEASEPYTRFWDDASKHRPETLVECQRGRAEDRRECLKHALIGFLWLRHESFLGYSETGGMELRPICGIGTIC